MLEVVAGVVVVVGGIIWLLMRKTGDAARVKERQKLRKTQDEQAEKLKQNYKNYIGSLRNKLRNKLRDKLHKHKP